MKHFIRVPSCQSYRSYYWLGLHALVPVCWVVGLLQANHTLLLGSVKASAGSLSMGCFVFGVYWMTTHYPLRYVTRWLGCMVTAALLMCGLYGIGRCFPTAASTCLHKAIWEQWPPWHWMIRQCLLCLGAFLPRRQGKLPYLYAVAHPLAIYGLWWLGSYVQTGDITALYEVGGLGDYLLYLLGMQTLRLICTFCQPRWQQVAGADLQPFLPSFFQFFLQLFLFACVFANVLVVKHFQCGSYIVTMGVLPYVLTFVCTDVVSEVYGTRRAKLCLPLGFAATLLLFLFWGVSYCFPALDHPGADPQAFAQSFYILSASLIASLGAYLAAQSLDLRLFRSLKHSTKGRYLWLRNNVATAASQFLDTIIFALLFWLTGYTWSRAVGQEWLSWQTWSEIAWSEYQIKLLLALLDTPLVYLAVYWGKRGLQASALTNYPQAH